MSSSEFKIPAYRQFIFFYFPLFLEVVTHSLEHYLVEKLKDVPHIEFAIGTFEMCMWFLVIYGVGHAMHGFLHFFYDKVTKMELTVNQLETIPSWINTIKEVYPISHVGVVNKISTTNIWDFREKITAWNPNWSIETDAEHILHEDLLDVHLKRLESDDINEICYIFLDGYSVDVGNSAKFGVNCFLDFLNLLHTKSIARRKQKRGAAKGISDYIGKYKIFNIPMEIWSDENLDIGKEVNYYKSFILIWGSRKNRKTGLIIFINGEGFLIRGRHEYYTEIFHEGAIYDSLRDSIGRIVSFAETKGVRSQKVQYDKHNGFSLVSS